MTDRLTSTPPLPIHLVSDAVVQTLRAGNRLVLTAPTGSGKTTQVPQILHQRLALEDQHPQVVILQPRRLAARLVAQRVAGELGSPLGGLVGFQTRHESCVSHATRIRFITEGLFLRQIPSNPALRGVGCVILDEFHERNLASDVSLALVKRLQESRRPDLRVVVMSATLDVQLVARYLACPVIEAHGRTFPVRMHYLGSRSQSPPWELAADALAQILNEEKEGDVLIFMPGGHEIRRTIEACRRHQRPDDPIALFPLYSELPARQQDAALAPHPHRKVIVSTNVAETSITIEGVRHVIDSGLARVNRFDPRRGINVLLIEPIARSSADQRAGRAGRTAPGTCTRLWTEAEHRARAAHQTPEVQRLDLAEVLLQLHSLGIHDPVAFEWIQPPDRLAIDRATQTLLMLGAVDETGQLTPLGRQMALLPMHPRLSRMLVQAGRHGCRRRAATWAALISERDILLRNTRHPFADDPPPAPRSDFVILERALETARQARFDPARCADTGVNANAAREVDRTARLYLESIETIDRREVRAETDDLQPMLQSLLVGFSDHLAIRRSEANLACALVRQRRGVLDGASIATHVGLLLPLEITEVGSGNAVKTVLSMVSEIEPRWLREILPNRITHRRETVLNPDTLAAETLDREYFDDLLIDEKPAPVNVAEAAEILAEQIFKGALRLEKWDESVEQWIARTRCVAQWFPDRRLITYSDDELRVVLSEICSGATRYRQVQERPCLAAVKDALSWQDQQFVEQMAPERILLPSGWRMKIEYTPGQPPRGRAKIQDLFGMNRSPTVAGGRQTVLLEILAPNFRPVQVTDNLANFWTNLYPQLRKELSRRYPRHKWM